MVIDPGQDKAAGRVSLSLIKIADVHLRTTIGGRAVTAVIRRPAQRAIVTFPAKAKQQVLIKFSGSTFRSPADTITLDGPHGATIDAPVPLNTKSGKLPAVKLAKPGTYTVLIDPSFNGDTGKVTVTVSRATGVLPPPGPRSRPSPFIPVVTVTNALGAKVTVKLRPIVVTR